MLQMKIAKGDNADLSEMELVDSNEYPVVFKWSSQKYNARTVHLAGSWDQWKRKMPLVKSTNDFSTIINLNPGMQPLVGKGGEALLTYTTIGRYEYKFLVDGKWMVDEEMSKTDNPMGSQNNVINIDEADFAVSPQPGS